MMIGSFFFIVAFLFLVIYNDTIKLNVKENYYDIWKVNQAL